MQFEPMGGFPPIIRKQDAKISGKTLESRGFATTNIVGIDKIFTSKKKQDLYFAFGSDEDDNLSRVMNDIVTLSPNEYEAVRYREI